MKKSSLLLLANSLLILLFFFTSLSAQTKLLRFPDIHGNELVFCYGGDLWKAPDEGGIASRLTAHPGQEIFPKFSPDGNWIAFTGQYDGDEQVYVIPAQGGTPKQLTYYPAVGPLPPRWGYDNQVYGWSNDGKSVLFRSLRDANGGSVETALYTVSVEGGLPVKLPMPTSGAGDFSPDGTKMVYSPLFRDFRHWKRYEGGWAQDLYIVDLNSLATTPVSQTKRTERDPMWFGGKIYFVSDRDGTLNLFKFDPGSSSVEQITSSTEWDVRWPSADNKSRIIYELGGELKVLDVSSNKVKDIGIQVPNDGLSMRPSRYPAYKNIESYDLSPKGERALFVARGDIFTTPIEKGSTRNLTNSSGAHDRAAAWSPDGKNIAFISDMSGEDQFYLIDQLGKNDPIPLTTSIKEAINSPRWSPNSKHLAFSTGDGELFTLNVSSKEVKRVDKDEYGGIGDFTWSPGGAYLAYSKGNSSGFGSLYIYSLSDSKIQRITEEYFNESEPVWDPDGNYLFYFSDRQFAPQFSTIEWNFATNRTTGIFAMALRADVPNLFAPESDEVTTGKKEEPKDEGKKKKGSGEKTGKAKTVIDFNGLSQRVSPFPIEAGNYNNLLVSKGKVFYQASGAGFYGRGSYQKPELKFYDIEKRKENTLVSNMGGYLLSFEGNKVLVGQQGKYNLYDPVPNAKDKKTISTKGLMVDRVPKEEWENIFWEVWRRYRDFFYVDNMHGYDWKAIGDQYAGLLEHVAHRSDLNYVIAEMIAELSVGHAYIIGGDFEIPSRPRVALPGARFELDPTSGLYRISKIFAGENEENKYRSPLTEVGVNAKVGDFVQAIDGEELKGTDNPYRLLQHKTDPVTLTLSSTASKSGSREVKYKPRTSESSLLYKEWTDGCRKMVSDKTEGKVGYIHIPNMGGSGIYEFIKWFYPQIRMGGMVVDVRGNGGGNVSQWIIERLDTKLLGTRFGYASDNPRTYPYTVFHGHKVCLMNGTSASDGDIFPHRFRKAGLGPLIGKRTWGGVVGYSGSRGLIDGGSVVVPMQATNDTNGDYIIEGVGVAPDIEIDNDPASVIAGGDPQLEKGISEILKMMEKDPMTLPNRPPDPVKTK
jgi:tricorn protease